MRRKNSDGNSTFVPPVIKQRATDAEIRSRKEAVPETNRSDFLRSLFG